MKNKTKYIKLFIIAFALIVMGCEDFLEKNPQGKLTQETFPVTIDDALLATNACYSTIRKNTYHCGLFPLTDIMSDDAVKGSNAGDQASTIGPYNSFTFTTTGSELASWWSTLYEGIKYTNVVIEKIPAIEMDETLKNRYLGEAHFLRGLYYFDLMRAWGGVPLITTTTPALKVERESVETIYQFILNDLLFAIDNLEERSLQEPKDLGRASVGAAKALLAKVYLFMGDYENTEKYSLQVIESKEYGLEPIFTDANSENGEYGIESVFEVGAQRVEAEAGDQYANVQGVRGTPNRGWGFNRPTKDLRESFETGDPRLKGTIIDLGDVIDGITILGDGQTDDVTMDDLGNVIETECYNRKVWTNGLTVATQYGHNRRLIRYSEVLLMAAEALNENDKTGDALNYLNEVRERAREGNTLILPDITETDKSALREIIINERRHELALEGQRFWDLVRTGKATEVLGPLGFVTGKHELFPIPQSEIDLSQGMLTQNPLWE